MGSSNNGGNLMLDSRFAQTEFVVEGSRKARCNAMNFQHVLTHIGADYFFSTSSKKR